MTTIRANRRARLAEKLAEVFELKGIGEVVAEMPCWLLRSVLLQGYIYLTTTHLCFFAHMPAREDQVLKSGSLNKKAQRTKRWSKHWFVLKNDVISWFHSASDPYFPHGVLDLRYAISCEPQGEKGLCLRTTQKTVELMADSVPNRDEWVKAIRKVIFKAQNMGKSVKIAVPYSAILDVCHSSAMDFSETIEIKVVDKVHHTGYSVDSYFFAYFKDLNHALEEIRAVVAKYRREPSENEDEDVVKDTTHARLPYTVQSAPPSSHAHTLPEDSSRTSVFRKVLNHTPLLSPRSKAAIALPRDTDQSSVLSASRPPLSPGLSTKSLGSPGQLADHTYPPSVLQRPVELVHAVSSSLSTWALPTVPGWIKHSRLFSTSPGQTGISEVVSSVQPTKEQDQAQEMGFSILETKETMQDIDPQMAARWRGYFALDDKETLLGYFPGYLFRVLPASGRVYVSTNHLCFRSNSPLTRTRMMIPIRDILSIEKTKPFRFGQYGLVIVIRGFEELFFEFSGSDKRNACVDLLNAQMDNVQKRIALEGEQPDPSTSRNDTIVLEELDPFITSPSDAGRATSPEYVPSNMFTSASSSFLTFKPTQPLRFTFLTIGSRGDVQPYIALGKGLLADGHRVKIATHGEFKEWIESHGLEYGYVGGDPAELMRLCVENGTFTVSFLREGVTVFRGWIDDLLKTAWEACQGSDVLIESPSAMAGIHIAEALKIPYFRAFTMPWTRTRAYPHAFAVPEHKMGGAYNYMTYVMFDQVLWRGTSSQINRWRRRLLGLPSTNLDKLEQHKVPFLYNFSPSIVPPPLDWYEWIRVTGFWFLDDADVSATKWEPPKDLVDFINNAHNSGKKVVYLGFGSIVVPDPVAMTKTVVEAITDAGVCAILSKGWSDRLAHKHAGQAPTELVMPAHIFQVKSVPHDWLFRRIDAACHHGGAGTTGASLRAGIPTIIKPFFGDQFFWADRVEALGIGSGVRTLTVEALSAALKTATTDEKQISRAAAVGRQIRSETGVATAIESIYRDLEYARTLVKRQHEDDEIATIRDKHYHSAPSGEGSPHFEPYTDSSHESSNGSSAADGTLSEDWSVISSNAPDDDERSPTVSTPAATSTAAPAIL
ncbi:UDP-Glycosyltransferase/glycogen phosphorylase [Auriculariales sp. MPI-PUGE-AT-0066]|nr:UDP-Glycosyltransferase/glycogen phosphorylase [Auriculariales sp. MPI-PUGE-AT-0066]